MKNIFRKTIALVLSLALMMSCGIFAFSPVAAAAGAQRTTTIPTVYVQGYGHSIYADAYDSNSEKIVGGDVPFMSDGVLGGLLESIIEPLMAGIATGDYTEYNDIIVNTLVTEFETYALDKNGEPSDGSGNFCDREKNIVNKNWNGGKYDLFAYSLVYDWRIDPFVTAAELNDYIIKVKAATGSPKVNIVGRCLGANIVMTYLSEYGYDDVNAVNFYIAGFEGFDIVSALYTGEVVLDTDALDRFVQANLMDDEDGIITFLKSLVAILNFINGLDLPVDIVYSIYDQVYYDIIPRVLKETFGTMPAFWSFVGRDYYEKARAFNFPTPEEEAEYAELLEKTDRYYNQVSLRHEEILEDAVEAGVCVYFTAKYGFTAPPLSVNSSYHGDGTTSVISQTIGTTSVEMGDTFSRSYIEKAIENGTDKYISPDKCIDASTALMPEHTWFIKGSRHANMTESINVMMAQIFEATGYAEKYVTIDDLIEYPQYLMVDSDEKTAPLYIMTEENANIGDEKWNVSIFDHLIVFFDKLFNFIIDFVYQIMELVNNTEI